MYRKAAGEEVGVRPGAEAPFECPLTGVPLNGRNRTFLHKPSGILFTESGSKKIPKVAQELILEACRKVLEETNGMSEKKKAKKAGAARAIAQAVVDRGGKWEENELLVVNPEGDDAEDAKGLLHCINVTVWIQLPADLGSMQHIPTTAQTVYSCIGDAQALHGSWVVDQLAKCLTAYWGSVSNYRMILGHFEGRSHHIRCMIATAMAFEDHADSRYT